MTFPEQTDLTSVVGLCTPEQVKDRLGITKPASDDKITAAIAAVLPTFSNRYHREFMGHVTETRVFDTSTRFVSFGDMDLRQATEVVLDPDGTATVLVEGVDYLRWPIDELTGTAGHIKLAAHVNMLCPAFTAFGTVPVAVTGAWGIWADVADVPDDVNEAAIITVGSWISKPASDMAGIAGGEPRAVEPGMPTTWDVPFAAHVKMLAYSRATGLGVY